MIHWFLTVTGINAPGSPWYNFWSGFGSDLGLLTGILIFYWKHSCHQSGCYRPGRHNVGGSPFCGKHHELAKSIDKG